MELGNGDCFLNLETENLKKHHNALGILRAYNPMNQIMSKESQN